MITSQKLPRVLLNSFQIAIDPQNNSSASLKLVRLTYLEKSFIYCSKISQAILSVMGEAHLLRGFFVFHAISPDN